LLEEIPGILNIGVDCDRIASCVVNPSTLMPLPSRSTSAGLPVVHRVEPKIVAQDAAKLFCLLSTVTYAFSLGQRRPAAQGGGTAGTGARGRDSSSRGTTPPLPATRRLVGASRLRRRSPS
jgi:hypothetical protein